jgi:hypothetical protein
MLRLLLLIVCGIPVLVSPAAAAEKPEPANDQWILLSKDLSAFQKPTAPWAAAGGAHLDPKDDRRLVAEPGHDALVNVGRPRQSPDLVTKQQWGDVEVSLEFMIPRAANSGVKLQGLYEIQIKDSAKVAKPTGAHCGGIYPRAEAKPKYHHLDDGVPPRVNAARPPGQWQTLHVLFRAPRFDVDGHKTANARFEKVTLNDKLIHENVEVAYPTGVQWHSKEKEAAAGPLLLQGDHGTVAFRHVRLRPLPKPDSGK